jgi:hypothetical protein
LTPGKTYHYLLQAQVKRRGETVRTSETVEVQAGKETPVYMEFPSGA